MHRGRPCSSTWRVALAFLLGAVTVDGYWCPVGSFITVQGGCVQCPADSTSTGAEMADTSSEYRYGGQTSCYCMENFRANFDSGFRGICEACPAGMTRAAGDEVCIRDPTVYCDASWSNAPQTTYCDGGPPCAENEYVTSSYTCVACPEHSTNPAGDEPGAGATSCK